MSAICVYTSSQTLPEIYDCRLRLVVTRPTSSQALTSVPGCPSAMDLFTKQNDAIVTSLLSWYSVSWYSVVLVFADRIFTDKNTQWRVHLEITFFETKLVPFLSRVSILTRDIDIANMSVCLSVCPSVCLLRSGTRWKRFNISSVCSPYGSPIILVLPASNICTKFRRGTPCGALNTSGV